MSAAFCNFSGHRTQWCILLLMLPLFATYGEVVITILVALVIALLGWIARLEFRLHRFMRGSTAGNLEGAITTMASEHSRLAEAHKALERSSQELRKLLGDAIRGVSVVRFNALAGDTSGKQSFAAAILSERGDGVVLSSMHARENARVYAKPIRHFASEHELTNEEKQAILEARKKYGASK